MDQSNLKTPLIQIILSSEKYDLKIFDKESILEVWKERWI